MNKYINKCLLTEIQKNVLILNVLNLKHLSQIISKTTISDFNLF